MKRLALFALLGAGCLTLDPFYFGNEPVDEYRWDADPCDPQLQGEISEAEHVLLGGPPPSCHPSLIGPGHRTEGFVDVDGVAIHWVYARREGARATIFYSHGTGRHLGRYWDRVELMWGLGFNVMIYDYPGYGRSEGEPDEAGIFAAARAVLELLPTMPGVDSRRVFFMGYSLGGAPTYEMALAGSRGELRVRPRGVLTEAAFCSTQALIEDGSRLDLPVEFFSDNPFDNCAKIGGIAPDVPIAIVHGADDSFVVPTHARRLQNAAGRDVELTFIEGADHDQVPTAGGDEYEALLTEFFSR